MDVLSRYYVVHATTQNYDGMIEFFRQQLPHVQAAAAASTSAMHVTTKDDEIAALKLELKAAKANVAAAVPPPTIGGQRGAPGRGGRGRGGRNQAGRGQRTFHYCYKHGSRSGHPGSICKDMQTDTSYTQAMRNAVGPERLLGNDGIWYPGAN